VSDQDNGQKGDNDRDAHSGTKGFERERERRREGEREEKGATGKTKKGILTPAAHAPPSPMT
jgi:hypothetical protein